jgi:hypothetical protein
MNLERREDLRSTLWGCGLVFIVQLLFAAIDLHALGPGPMWLDLAHAVLAGAGFLLLLWKRSGAFVALTFAAVALAFLPQTWWSEIVGARQGALRDPLLPHEFLLLGIAMLAPAWRRIGLVMLVVVTGSGVALWLFLRARFSLPTIGGEPWMLIAFAAVGIGVGAHRLSRRRTLHQLLTSRAEAKALAKVAVVFRAFRDRANTPLQTLEIGTALLARKGAVSAAGICAMDRAIVQLRELSALLEGADVVPGEGPESLSTDLAGAIEDALRTMHRAPPARASFSDRISQRPRP